MRSRPGRSYNSHAGLIFPAHPAEGSRRGSGNRALSNRLQDCRGVSDQQERTHPMNMASDVTRVRASRVWLSAVAIALLLVVSNTAPATAQSTATVMVSNLGEAEYARIWLNPGQAYAHSFHTGNTAVTLEKVRLYLRGAESTPAVTIRADNSGQPYRSLQALTNPSIDSSIDTYEDFTTTGYVLAANTTYWVVFHRQWGSKPFSFSVTLSETGSDNNWCNELGTPDSPYTGEDGWSLGENLFFGLGSRWGRHPSDAGA